MTETLIRKIEALDDKQACHIITRFTRDLLSKWKGAPNFTTLAHWATALPDPGGPSHKLSLTENWTNQTLRGGNGGAAARSILKACAEDEDLAPAVQAALTQYGVDQKADLGVLSLPIAIGLAYLLIAGDVDIDLGFIRIRKKGLSSAEQKEIAPKIIGDLLKGAAPGE